MGVRRGFSFILSVSGHTLSVLKVSIFLVMFLLFRLLSEATLATDCLPEH